MPVEPLVILSAVSTIMIFIIIMSIHGTYEKASAKLYIGLVASLMFLIYGVWGLLQPLRVEQVLIVDIQEMESSGTKYQIVNTSNNTEPPNIVNITKVKGVWFNSKKAKISKFNRWIGPLYVCSSTDKIEPCLEQEPKK